MHTDLIFPMVQSKQTFEIPLILEEPYDLIETAALHYGPDSESGLLAGADHSTAFLSMSGYGKSHTDDADDYESKSYHDTNYAYTEPHSARQYSIATVAAPEASSAESMPYIAASPFQPRASFDAAQGLYSDYRTRELPTVISWIPAKGARGTKVFVTIQSPYDLTEAPILSFPLVFGIRRQTSEMTKKSQQGQYYQYTLAADVPPFSTTGWHSSSVKLAMQMNDENGHIMGSADIGDFHYTDTLGPPAPQATKRKTSEDTTDTLRGPMKRTVSTQQIRSKGDEEYSMMPYGQRSASAYSPYLHPSASHTEPSPRTRQGSIHFSNAGAIQSAMKGRSPGTPVWTPGYAGTKIGQNPGLGISSAKVRTSISSVDANTPQLVRTTLQHSSSPASTTTSLMQGSAPFNPYSIFPSKAVLNIDGKLESMAEGSWTMEEWEAKRRIVQFRRSQSGSTITTQFEPVAIDQRPPNSICISCIWWEEKKECFVTSVDTIYLLESLVAVRFTVEEKNRIRRNLEGFKPLTVSKAKADSEEFFKIIMGFPNPKPRNIEKDVKVFPWKILAHALKKIISKYSASYSSTAGAIVPISGAGYGSSGSMTGTASEMVGGGQRPTPSPRSTSASITTVTRTPSLTSLAYSPNNSQSGQQPLPAATPDLRVNPSALGSHFTSIATSWPQQTHQAQFTEQSQQGYPVTSQAAQGSWDFPGYLEAGPATTVSTSDQTVYYPTIFSTGEDINTIQRRMSHHTTGP